MKLTKLLLMNVALFSVSLLPVVTLTSCGGGGGGSGSPSGVSTATMLEVLNNANFVSAFSNAQFRAVASDQTADYRVADGETLITFPTYTSATAEGLVPNSVSIAEFDTSGDVLPGEFDEYNAAVQFASDGFFVTVTFFISSGSSIGGAPVRDETKNVNLSLFFRYVQGENGAAGFELDSSLSTYTFNGVPFTFQPNQRVYNNGTTTP